jgi:hypothetical protein
MICERCGHEITGNTSSVLCPICGTVVRKPARAQLSGSYIQSFQNYPSGQPVFSPGDSPTSQTALQSYTQSSNNGSEYTVHSFHVADTINAPTMASFTLTSSYDKALMVEFIFSLLGIFGVGWLLAGETTAGFLLLAASILIYWPMMILGTLVTLGFGLMCLGPLAVSCVICNTLLLNICLKRKMACQR